MWLMSSYISDDAFAAYESSLYALPINNMDANIIKVKIEYICQISILALSLSIYPVSH